MTDGAAPPTPHSAAPIQTPMALNLVFVIVLVEAVAEIIFVVFRHSYGPGGRALLIIVLASKIWFAALTRKLSAGGVLGLLSFELVGLLAAVFATWDVVFRIGLGVSIVAVFALVISSMHAFPTPEIR